MALEPGVAITALEDAKGREQGQAGGSVQGPLWKEGHGCRPTLGLGFVSLPVWAIQQVERSAWLCPLLSLHRLQIRWRSSASDSGPLSTSPHGPGRRVSTHLCVNLQKTVCGLPAHCSGGVPAGVGAGCVTGPLAELSALWAVS